MRTSSDINSLAIETDNCLVSRDSKKLGKLLKRVESICSDEEHSPIIKSYLHYFMGNICSGLSEINSENVGGWRNDDFPIHSAQAINSYRIAQSYAIYSDSPLIKEIESNLANQLAHHRRSIEVLEYWESDFNVEGDAPFVSSLSKARELIWLQHWLDDRSHAECFLNCAYNLVSFLKKNISNTSHPDIVRCLSHDSEIIKLIEFGDRSFVEWDNWDTTEHQNLYKNDERAYRAWCLKHHLFVNPLNDITTKWIADKDQLQFPSHIVKINQGPFFSAAFSALKREFCFARFLAYEGIHNIHPSFENESLVLTNTLDEVQYGGHVEKLKASFRISFSVLDSLSLLMNRYFDCKSEQPSFSSRWIRNSFRDIDSPFIDALYWLACDLTDIEKVSPDKWKAPNPIGMQIRQTRNHIEHGWLRVANSTNEIWDEESDFAYVLTLDDLQRDTLFVLKTVRSALLYFCFAVKFNERETHPIQIKVPIMDDAL